MENQKKVWTEQDKWSALIPVAVFSNSKQRELIGFILVKETRGNRGIKPYWKYCGGKRKAGESHPSITALRELREETGLILSLDTLIEIDTRWQKNYNGGHWVITYLAHIFECDVHKINSEEIGNQGEVPKYFSVLEKKELITYNKFLRHHLSRAKLIIDELQ